jgi:hypothetical protein
LTDILIEKIQQGSLEIEYTPSDIVNKNHAPITYVDAKLSFSQYKSILRPKSHIFLFVNLQQYVVFSLLCSGIIFIILYTIGLIWGGKEGATAPPDILLRGK